MQIGMLLVPNLTPSKPFGREITEQLQLQLEYDPDPPFRAGHPAWRHPNRSRARLAGRHAQRKAQLAQLRAR